MYRSVSALLFASVLLLSGCTAGQKNMPQKTDEKEKIAFPNNKTKKEVFIMASAKKTLNPLTDTPTSKAEITKPFMLAYMRQVASEEDKAWFKKIVADVNNHKEYINKLNGQPYTGIDVPKVRKFFTDRFFPQLNAKKRRTSPLLILFLPSN